MNGTDYRYTELQEQCSHFTYNKLHLLPQEVIGGTFSHAAINVHNYLFKQSSASRLSVSRHTVTLVSEAI